MSHHEACGPHEIFVGNQERAEGLERFASKGMRTVRLGAEALDIEGKSLPDSYAPIFISRSESDLHNDIMMTKLMGSDWRRRV